MAAAAFAALLALLVPLSGVAGVAGGPAEGTFVDPALLAAAQSAPGAKLEVIIQSSAGTDDAGSAVTAKGNGGQGSIRRQLELIGAVAATVPGGRLLALAKRPGLTITADAPVTRDAYANVQLWPYSTGLNRLWGSYYSPAPPAPTIAIVDSGVDPSRPDLWNKLLIPQVTITKLPQNSPNDGNGHGTFVASLAAGVGNGHVGAAPNAKLISLDVLDDNGMALTSDVVAAAQWIFTYRNVYNIRVANFSLHSTAPSHFVVDPLDKAVEKLWLNGVVVVAAAGNYGVGGAQTSVLYAPSNDPFVITVGAADLMGTASRGDDVAAPFSAWGYTADGFAKPELGAPGRYMIGAVPLLAALVSARPANVVSSGYMQLSGTSFAAPIVAGAAAQLLARRPGLQPDEVKGLLMLGADDATAATPQSLGAGELNAAKSARLISTVWPYPNPNAALGAFVATDLAGVRFFNGLAWEAAVTGDPGWDAAAWDTKYWGNASWDAKYWGDVAWDTKYWGDLAASDVSWASQAQSDTSREAAADADPSASGYALTADEAAALAADPALAGP
ncbi:MAG: serine protease AprX [Gaiellaceae bacterium]|nr:serine protease AprX [Gaiellaceae bacterium]